MTTTLEGHWSREPKIPKRKQKRQGPAVAVEGNINYSKLKFYEKERVSTFVCAKC